MCLNFAALWRNNVIKAYRGRGQPNCIFYKILAQTKQKSTIFVKQKHMFVSKTK